MPFITPDKVQDRYDMVVVGSGFGSLFFVKKAIERDPKLRVLMLEWGKVKPHEQQVADGRNSDIDDESTFRNLAPKVWNFTIGFGGGTNCWFGQTPRLLPNDFRIKTLYGVGQDWPVTYDELEPYYGEAEEIIAIAGPNDNTVVSPRSRPYPQPPHRFTTPDEMMKKAQPDRHFAMPTARAREATATRNPCCATGRCSLCPVNAKFTAENGLQDLIAAPQLSILTDARVTHLVRENGIITRAAYVNGGREHEVRGDLFVLGANALQSPAVLLRSGIDTPLTGAGLTEQLGYEVEVFLDGVDNFDGGTLTTGLNYSVADGAFRSTSAATLLYFENRWKFGLRKEYGRWRQSLPLVMAFEDLPSDKKAVAIAADGTPNVSFAGHADYAEQGVKAVMAQLPKILSPLPIEKIVDRGYRPTESHLECSLRMGHDKSDSVVDAGQLHHDVRNLVVVGSSVFPTCPSANPSLTVAALSLRAADRLMRRA